jgi:HlyD family secretion protein
MNTSRIAGGIFLLSVLALSACDKAPPQALGTLEYDRITLPAPAAERVVEVLAREGERVRAGQVLLKLDPAHAQAQLAAAEALVAQQQQALAELETGPRTETINKARAELDAAKAVARDAQAQYVRLRSLKDQGVVTAAALDQARSAAGSADGQVKAAGAALDELLHGSRSEDIAQARSALAAEQANAQALRVLLDKLTLTAPRDGIIDSLPYKLGDQAPVGAPLVVELVGDAPYARIYVPEPQHARLAVGDKVSVQIVGRAQALAGVVRMLQSEPVYTPYYALTGADAARLSYLAEVSLGKDAASLPAGLPLTVRLPDAP